MKKFYISVDLEGIACVTGSWGKGLSDSPDYRFACEQGTREADAAARALFDSGASEVYVWDSHGGGYNLKHELLDKRVKFVLGAGSRKRFPDIDETFSGILFIGYHAYDTIKATLSHVYSSAVFQYYKINGKHVGEMQIDASIAGKYGVPVIFASSDDICISQALDSFGDISHVVTKKSLAWNSCISKHPLQVADEIYENVKAAANNLDKFKPYTITSPFELEIRYKRMETAMGCSYRNPDNTLFELLDPYTRKGTLESPEHIFEF